MINKKLLFILLTYCSLYNLNSHGLTLTSEKFVNNNLIPKVYTCEGNDISPPLAWTDIPNNTKSLALIVDDPDSPDPAAPKITWVHWVIYNLPAIDYKLAENVATETLPKNSSLGINDWNSSEYKGPCPPIGEHRYYFKLYALDIALPDLNQPNKQQLEAAMTDHVIAKTELIAKYKKQIQ